MARNTIGMRRGSVRGAPPGLYVPFGTYHPDEKQLRETIKFFSNWFQIAIIFVVVIFALALFVTFTEDIS